MKTLLFTIFSFVFISFGSAQEIRGQVTDRSDSSTLPYVNIVLYDLGGEAKELVVTEEDGTYRLSVNSEERSVLEISSIGYVTLRDTLSVSRDTTINYILSSSSYEIDEITVTARRPTITHTAGKTVVSLANTLVGNQNLSSLLKQVPGLIVSRNGVKVGGVQNATILINGQTTRYMDVSSLLQDFPAENIKSIEIIKQADASFEASGTGPILNIVLKRNNLKGTHGSVSAAFGIDNNEEYNAGVSLYSYHNSLNVEGSLNYSKTSFIENLDIMRSFIGVGYNQINTLPIEPATINARFGTDYYIDDHHKIGVSLAGYQRTNDYFANNLIEITSSSTPTGSTSLLSTRRKTHEERSYWRVNPYYEYTWDPDSDGYLRVNLRYLDYRTNDDYYFLNQPESTIPDYQNQQTLQKGVTHLYNIRLDYMNPLSQQSELKLGGRYDRTDRDNQVKISEENDGGTLIPLPEKSDDFIIDEDIYAAYGQYSYNTEKWELSSGLRWENSRAKGYSVTLDSTQTLRISKLFPNVSGTYNISDKIALNSSYAYRINRPSFGSLNPFSINYDPLTQDSGNPRLQPEFAHNAALRVLYESQPAFEFTYISKKDPIYQDIIQDGASGNIQRKYINIDSEETMSFQFGVPLFMIPHVEGGGSFTVNYQKFNNDQPDSQFEHTAWSWVWGHQITFELPLELRLENYFYYVSGGLEDALKIEPVYNTGFELSRTFLEDKLQLSFRWNDVIRRKSMLHFADTSIDGRVDSYESFGWWQISARYKFGKKSYKKNKKSNLQDSGLDRLD